ncbi:MAG: hypothetical protein CMB56_006640 [Methanobacteriota archaeon]|nr:MAG: hypothetical protein CMB56_006640 [Euryarchaeota archaeon]|tara:strand:+ start:27750 stop:28118 length:369 start_codon:yes stop_codon:yes gene_type:complete
MGEEVVIRKIQNRILSGLLFSVLAAFIVGINFSPIEGYYVFAVLFILISLTMVISNLELIKVKLEFSSFKFIYLFLGLLFFILVSFLFSNNLGYPLGPSMILSLLCLLFFNWVYYSLEPMRG